jgi:hypothetical protein
MNLNLSVYLAFFVFVISSSCMKEVGFPPEVKVVETCDSIGVYTYGNFVASVMNTNCTFSGCHNAGSSNGDYTSYAGIKLKVDNGTFANRVFVTKDMPPTYSSGPLSLSDCDIAKLKKWVNSGAPQ